MASETSKNNETQGQLALNQLPDGGEAIDPGDARMAQKAYGDILIEKKAGKVNSRWLRLCEYENSLKRFKEAGIETILYSEEIGFQLVNALHAAGKEAVIRAIGSWWTPQSWIESRPGPGGLVLAYVPREYIDAVLSAFFPGRWSFDAYDFEVTEHEVNCLGKLTVFWPDGSQSWCVQPGVAQIKRFSQGHPRAGEPISIGNDKKAASTDARKKAAATLLRIAWDVYGGLRTASEEHSQKAVDDMAKGQGEKKKPAKPKQPSKKTQKKSPVDKQREEYRKRYDLSKAGDLHLMFKGYMNRLQPTQEQLDRVIAKYPAKMSTADLQEAIIDLAILVNKEKNGGGA